jgi:type I restriction enzyme M protein
MSTEDQKRLGDILWGIADELRGSMNADDFRDYMLSFLFLRYLSDNYETAAKKELGNDYPETARDVMKKLKVTSALQIWYNENKNDIVEFERQMRRKVHYVILPMEQYS